MPRGIPNSRVEHTSHELADDLGVHDSFDHFDPDEVLDLSAPGAGSIVAQVRAIEPVNTLGFKVDADNKDDNGGARSLEYEKFMEDLMVIQIASTTDKNAPLMAYVGLNGDGKWLPRNRPIRIQRKFVERLAQAQERSFTTPNNPDPAADVGMLLRSSQALSYSFSVIHDPAGERGRRWLQATIRSGS